MFRILTTWHHKLNGKYDGKNHFLCWARNYYDLHSNVAAVVLGQLGETLLTLTPSTPSITHFVNDSFIIFCKTVQKDISTKWKDPNGTTRENTKGRVHIEKKAGKLRDVGCMT